MFIPTQEQNKIELLKICWYVEVLTMMVDAWGTPGGHHNEAGRRKPGASAYIVPCARHKDIHRDRKSVV